LQAFEIKREAKRQEVAQRAAVSEKDIQYALLQHNTVYATLGFNDTFMFALLMVAQVGMELMIVTLIHM
jgi:hypothetical protein